MGSIFSGVKSMYSSDRDKAHDRARVLGFYVIYPTYEELFVDIDDADGLRRFKAAIEIVKQVYPGATYTQHPSPSYRRNHFHITVDLNMPNSVNPLSGIERIAMQAFLGSDPKREALSWMRVRAGDTQPTLFFERNSKLSVWQRIKAFFGITEK